MSDELKAIRIEAWDKIKCVQEAQAVELFEQALQRAYAMGQHAQRERDYGVCKLRADSHGQDYATLEASKCAMAIMHDWPEDTEKRCREAGNGQYEKSRKGEVTP